MSRLAIAALLLATAAVPALALAGPELVAFPAEYQKTFTLYNRIERPDRSPAAVRFMYAQPAAIAEAKPGQPIPYGTVLIMEDRKVLIGLDGQPVRDAEGRMVTTDEVTAVAVQEKRPGWGEAYPADKRNGEWEYAAFNPDGTRRAVSTAGCFACHTDRRGRDFSFVFAKVILDTKK